VRLVSQPSFAVDALQSPKPDAHAGAHFPLVHVALETFVRLQVTPHAPQLLTLPPEGLPTERSEQTEFPEHDVAPAVHATLPVLVAPPLVEEVPPDLVPPAETPPVVVELYDVPPSARVELLPPLVR